MKWTVVVIVLFFTITIFAQEKSKSENPSDKILLTIFLKHDQSKSLDEINKILESQKFFQNFPPEGTSVVSWHVVMGIGQVVTLEVPASLLRNVNLAIEKHGWKAFKSEFYPTYDLYPIIQEKLKNKSKKNLSSNS